MDTQIVGVAVGFGFGLIQKYAFKFLPNWLIPILNPVLGAVVGHYVPGLGLTGGAVTGLAATGAHQLVKQPIQKATGRTL